MALPAGPVLRHRLADVCFGPEAVAPVFQPASSSHQTRDCGQHIEPRPFAPTRRVIPAKAGMTPWLAVCIDHGPEAPKLIRPPCPHAMVRSPFAGRGRDERLATGELISSEAHERG